MTDIGPSVTVYGWRMDDKDEHILKRIASRRVGRIAVSVFPGSQTATELDEHCKKAIWRIQHYNATARIEFFDSTSPGCWNNP
jgi:hypothetical protein